MSGCCCCGEAGERRHQAMMHHAEPDAEAAPASEHAGHTGQTAPAAGAQEGQGMKESCCCGEGDKQGHQAMMHHTEPDAEAAPAEHVHR